MKRPNPNLAKPVGTPGTSRDQVPSKWAPTNLATLTEDQKCQILSKVVNISVLSIFKNHQYQFACETKE